VSDKNKLTDKQLRVLIDEYSQSQTYVEYRPSDIANALTELRDRNRELEKLLADRDDAWERAIQSLAQQGVITIDDPIAAVRERLESEGVNRE
jgi:hypothetical protein